MPGKQVKYVTDMSGVQSFQDSLYGLRVRYISIATTFDVGRRFKDLKQSEDVTARLPRSLGITLIIGSSGESPSGASDSMSFEFDLQQTEVVAALKSLDLIGFKVIGHNLQSDFITLMSIGCLFRCSSVYDCLLAARAMDLGVEPAELIEQIARIKSTEPNHLSAEIKSDTAIERFWNCEHSLEVLVGRYQIETMTPVLSGSSTSSILGAGARSALIARLYPAQYEELVSRGLQTYLEQVTFPLIEHLANMELPGVTVAVDGVVGLIRGLRSEIQSVDFVESTASHRLLEQAKRLLNMTDSTGKIHPNWRQFGTRTGRIMARVVPGITKKLRKFIIPSPGYGIFTIDIRAAEFLMAAILSGDEELMRVYNTKDFYLWFGTLISPEIFDPDDLIAIRDGSIDIDVALNRYAESRESFKSIALGMLYDKTDETIARDTGLMPSHVRFIRQEWRERFRLLTAFMDRQVLLGSTLGELRLSNGLSTDVRNVERLSAVCPNNVIQAACADVFTRILLDCSRLGRVYQTHILFAQHDEIVAEAPLGRYSECVASFRDSFMKNLSRYSSTGDVKLTRVSVDDRHPNHWSHPSTPKKGEECHSKFNINIL